MNSINTWSVRHLFISSLVLIFFFLAAHCSAQNSDRNLIIHLRGVYDANIEVMNVQKKKYNFLPILEKPGVKGGETVTLTIPGDQLPGQFTVQFRYRLKESDYPYPAPRNIYIGAQDVEMWISPIYGNNPDSTWFSSDEKENNTYQRFTQENTRQTEKINLLQMLLLKYDDTGSNLYEIAEKEYEKRRETYNSWVDDFASEHKDLFVGRLFQFRKIPTFNFRGDEKARMQSMIDHYFEGINLNDDLLTGTVDLNDWLTMYVNLNNEMYTNKAEADTLLVKAARRLVEHARNSASSKVYGFVVDYFYNGFEMYDMMEGVKMLETYANDPRCLTSKRLEIQRRLDGLEALKIDAMTPEISLKDTSGKEFSFHAFHGNAPRKVLFFWSADCPHCMQLSKDLWDWYNSGHQQDVDVIAISLDETETEVAKWDKIIREYPGWTHLRAGEGINSKVAYDYAILATPYMYLVSSRKNTIIGIPDDVKQLNAMMVDPY